MVEAFLIGVKQEGPETVNCRRQDLHDYHLWMVDARDDTRAKSIVVEMTPRWLVTNTAAGHGKAAIGKKTDHDGHTGRVPLLTKSVRGPYIQS